MTTNSEERFDAIVQALAGEPAVSPPSRGNTFGSNALKVNGKIFAMLVRGQLAVKLPRQRTSELIDSGHAYPFDAGKGKPMQEWLTAPITSDSDWLSLAREAMEFVRARSARSASPRRRQP